MVLPIESLTWGGISLLVVLLVIWAKRRDASRVTKQVTSGGAPARLGGMNFEKVIEELADRIPIQEIQSLRRSFPSGDSIVDILYLMETEDDSTPRALMKSTSFKELERRTQEECAPPEYLLEQHRRVCVRLVSRVLFERHGWPYYFPLETEWDIIRETHGRGGYIYYREGSETIRFAYDICDGIWGPNGYDWTPERRREVLRRVARAEIGTSTEQYYADIHEGEAEIYIRSRQYPLPPNPRPPKRPWWRLILPG